MSLGQKRLIKALKRGRRIRLIFPSKKQDGKPVIFQQLHKYTFLDFIESRNISVLLSVKEFETFPSNGPQLNTGIRYLRC